MTASAKAVQVSREALEALATRILVEVGAPAESAVIVARSLVRADLSGHESHGIRLLVRYVEAAQNGEVELLASVTVTADMGAIVAINGGGTFGQVVMSTLANIVATRVRAHGICVAAVTNSGHFGRLCDIAETLAGAGLVSIIAANDGGGDQHVAPPGARAARLGTNPIAFGAPRSKAPHLIVDLATSAASHGTIEAMKNRGERIPETLAFADGTLLPMAAYKGYALSVMVDVLAGALTGAGVSRVDPKQPTRQGALVIAMDPNRFRPSGEVIADIEQLTDFLRSTPSINGEQIAVPGDHAYRTYQDRLVTGIEVPNTVAKELVALGRALGVETDCLEMHR